MPRPDTDLLSGHATEMWDRVDALRPERLADVQAAAVAIGQIVTHGLAPWMAEAAELGLSDPLDYDAVLDEPPEGFLLDAVFSPAFSDLREPSDTALAEALCRIDAATSSAPQRRRFFQCWRAYAEAATVSRILGWAHEHRDRLADRPALAKSVADALRTTLPAGLATEMRASLEWLGAPDQ